MVDKGNDMSLEDEGDGNDLDTLGDSEQCRDKVSQLGSKVRSLGDVGTTCA